LAQKLQSSAGKDGLGTIALTRVPHWGRDEIDELVDAINTANAEQRELQAREASAGRMEALGRLAGGIAHDFNNILGSILGCAGHITRARPPGGEDRPFPERTRPASDGGRALSEQIRPFPRAGVAGGRFVDRARVLKKNKPLLSASLQKKTRTRIDPFPAGLT